MLDIPLNHILFIPGILLVGFVSGYLFGKQIGYGEGSRFERREQKKKAKRAESEKSIP
jgi:hypothetical protein